MNVCRKIVCLAFFGLVFVSIMYSQDDSQMLEALEMRFIAASINDKVRILNEAAELEGLELGPLYNEALNFVLSNVRLIGSSFALREIAVIAARSAGAENYTAAKHNLWNVFMVFDDTSVRVEVLEALENVAIDDERFAKRITEWLDREIILIRSGQRVVDNIVILQAVQVLGKFNYSPAFPVLFALSTQPLSEKITRSAEGVMNELEVDVSKQLSQMLNSAQPEDLAMVLDYVDTSDALSASVVGELAGLALNRLVSLVASNPSRQTVYRKLRQKAASIITRLNWSGASNAAIKHFNMSIDEFRKGKIQKDPLIQAVNCLGAVGTTESGYRLMQYLQTANLFVRQGQPSDVQVTLAVINNLGNHGDNYALQFLREVLDLDYNDTVQSAARTAIRKIQES